MYKIEKFLLKTGFKLKKSYESGVLVYQTYDEDGFYGDEVVLFSKHTPKPEWEINIHYPYSMCLMSYREQGQEFIENCKENLEDHIKECMEYEKELRAIKDPWEIAE